MSMRRVERVCTNCTVVMWSRDGGMGWCVILLSFSSWCGPLPCGWKEDCVADLVYVVFELATRRAQCTHVYRALPVFGQLYNCRSLSSVKGEAESSNMSVPVAEARSLLVALLSCIETGVSLHKLV